MRPVPLNAHRVAPQEQTPNRGHVGVRVASAATHRRSGDTAGCVQVVRGGIGFALRLEVSDGVLHIDVLLFGVSGRALVPLFLYLYKNTRS